MDSALSLFDTEYDRAKVPPYNGNDPRPPLVVSKSPSVSTSMKQSTKQGNARARARYSAELPPIISIVRYPGRPVILGMDLSVGKNSPIHNESGAHMGFS